MAEIVQLKELPNGVFLLTFSGDGEHRFNPTSIAAIHSALDQVENEPSAAALVTTNEGKFYSNGLDLKFAQSGHNNFRILVDLFHKLLERMLAFPIPTVASICGHASAGGCMFALAHDYRVMRSDRGLIFLNEVDINLHLTPGMNAVVECKLPVNTYHKAVLSGHKYTGKTAEAAGFVYATFPDPTSTLEEALKRGTELAKKKYNRSVYKAIKAEMFRSALAELRSGEHGPRDGIVLSRL